MLEGLEISENNFSDLCSQELIFGSEFNSQKKEKALLKLSSSFKVNDFFQLKSNLVTKINRDSLVYDLTHSIGNFLQEGEIENEIRSAKKEVVENDFIISRLRSYLKEFAVVQHNKLKQLVSSEYLVYSQTDKRLSPNSLLAFCLTDEVQTIFNCSQYGTEHPRLYDFVFDQLPIPECLLKLNNEIDNLFSKAYSNLKASKQLYAEAEAILLSELGLNDWTPENKSVSIKSFSDFTKSGRLDAEYYQPKYDEIEAKIKYYKGGWDYLEKLFTLEDKNYNPKSDKEYKYIELSNIGSTGDITGCTLEIGENLPSRARRKVVSGNIIISSIEGSLQSCAVVTNEYSNALCSTGFYVLSPKNINSETAILLFKSKPLQELMKKMCSGTILTAMNKDEFLKIVIPKLSLSLQSIIATKIQASFSLKAESKALLERAKQMVENEIEKN